MKRIIGRWTGERGGERESAATQTEGAFTERSTGSFPAGTVTILHARMKWQGYKQFRRDHDPEVVFDIMKRFVSLASAPIQAHGGVMLPIDEVFQPIDDSATGVFTSPVPAILAAVDARRDVDRELWPEGHGVQGHWTLYTGEGEMNEYGYRRGDALKYALKLSKTYRPGQICMGERTAREAADHLPPGVTLVDEGPLVLLGFPPAEHVYAVAVAGFPLQ